jgi:hypothetical protein
VDGTLRVLRAAARSGTVQRIAEHLERGIQPPRYAATRPSTPRMPHSGGRMIATTASTVGSATASSTARPAARQLASGGYDEQPTRSV